MPPLELISRPALLVSVRNAVEALAALEGGADVIDVKEPDRGSLGPADSATIAAIIDAVAGRAPVTAAAGELVDLIRGEHMHLPAGIELFKIGLAGCRDLPHWKSRWLQTIDSIWAAPSAIAHAVAVVYADWRTAKAPAPEEVLAAAVDSGCPALLVDTWDKSSGGLFDHWTTQDICTLMQAAHARSLLFVLAGSLAGSSLTQAARLMPDLVAVRGAACDSGRTSDVSADRVATLRKKITDTSILSTYDAF